MDPARVALLFGPTIAAELEGLDGPDPLADPQTRATLLEAELGEVFEPLELAVAGAVANQILDDDPPHVWRTAERLLALGRDRVTVLTDLVAAFEPIVRRVLADEDQSDPAIYTAALDALPTSPPDDEPIASMSRRSRVRFHTHDDAALTENVLRIFEVADRVVGTDPEHTAPGPTEDETKALRSTLRQLADVDIFDAVAADLFEDARLFEPDAERRAVVFVAALLEAASAPGERATAHLLASRHAEVAGDLRRAEQHLDLAHAADGSNGAVIDRLAWYASDRGDAPRALQLWRLLEMTPAVGQDVRTVQAALDRTGPKVGRNDPCWCGSGRKAKQCHGDAPPLPSLPDRYAWLERKALGFLDRGPVDARRELLDVTMTLARDPDSLASLHQAMAHPVVRDLLLCESRWLETFVEDRGPLLPEDERALVAQWAEVERSIFEVTGVGEEGALTLVDDRTGDVVQVRDLDTARTVEVGDLVCARPLPDGAGHRLARGTFAVAPGSPRQDLAAVLAEHDPHEVATWVRRHEAGDDPLDHPIVRQAIEDRLQLDQDGGYQDAFLATPQGIAMLDAIRDKYEQRWCDQPHDELGGRTPREVVADPGRRAEVERAIEALGPDGADGADGADGENPVALRPARLRALLGLSATEG